MNPTVAAFEERIASLEGGAGLSRSPAALAAQLAAFYTLLQTGRPCRRLAGDLWRLYRAIQARLR